MWRAIRHGMDGRMIDLDRETEISTAAETMTGTRQLAQRAWEIWTRAQDALRRGDWATYGAEQKRLEETLRTLNQSR